MAVSTVEDHGKCWWVCGIACYYSIGNISVWNMSLVLIADRWRHKVMSARSILFSWQTERVIGVLSENCQLLLSGTDVSAFVFILCTMYNGCWCVFHMQILWHEYSYAFHAFVPCTLCDPLGARWGLGHVNRLWIFICHWTALWICMKSLHLVEWRNVCVIIQWLFCFDRDRL